MPDAPPQPFAEVIARRFRDAHETLASRWLARLHALLDVPADGVFPATSLLDHIPGLIRHIADALETSGEQAIVADTAVVSKAQELGDLRFSQRASLHQLVREYRLLGEVLQEFVADELTSFDSPVSPSEVLTVAARLQDATLVLMQATVDAFVSRYAATVEEQTARLEGFSRTVSHELRQPLDTIRTALALLMQEDGTAGDVHARCLSLIDANTRRITTLTTTLLTLSSLKAESLSVQETDVRRLVDDAVSQLADMAQRRAVDVQVRVPPLRVVVDTARVELILVNLVSNAIKYHDPRKPTRIVEVTARLVADRVRLSVRDNGVGIPAHLRDRVFERFFRAHAIQDRALGAEGVGLGLSIVAECARHLGATIEVESEDDHGSTFHVEFPSDAAGS